MNGAVARPHWAPWAAAGLGLVMVLVFAANVLLGLTMPAAVPTLDYTPLAVIGPFVPFVALSIISVVLILRQPRNVVAWLMAALVFAMATSNAGQMYLWHYLYSPDIPRGPVAPLGLMNVAVSQLSGLPLALMPLLFPDGRLPSRRWRSVVALAVLAFAVPAVVAALDPAAIGDGHRQLPNPVGVPAAHQLNATLNGASTIAAFIAILLAIASLVSRYRRAGTEVRQQVKWFGAGVVILVLCVIGGVATATTPTWTTPAPIAFEIVGFSALPVCIAIAILRYRLYEIDVVINRALVYGSLAAFITLVYVAIVVGAGTLLGGGGRPNLALSIVATAVVAVGFQPVRERLQRLANRLVYGRRATPYEVLSEFSGRVAETYAGDDVLPRMARVLAEGTGAVAATVWLRAGHQLRPAAAFPADADGNDPVTVMGQLLPPLSPDGHAVAVRHQGELLGALAVRKRAGEALTPIEQKLLADLANQAGLVLKNVGLTSDLEARLEDIQASRQRLVKAQDDERRRLERSLHDGAQKSLVELKERLAAARALATTSPGEARDLLGQLKQQTDATLQDLRDIARGIYPPLLAEKGLPEALEAQARKMAFPVTVLAEDVGRYPREAEATAYFCCVEALQNARLHAAASTAVVRVREDGGELRFEVEDDGAGFDPAAVRRGPGLTNMNDRLEALGGRLLVTSSPGGGSVVGGMVPVPAVAAAGV